MKKVLCIGEALIDMICTDKDRPLSEGENFIRKAGGAPTNAAAAIAALGGHVDLAAKVGNDPFGAHLTSVLQDFGVGTKWLLRDTTHFTTMAFVSLMKSGERDFHFNRGADGYLGKTDLAALDFDDYGIIHFGSATAFLGGDLQELYYFALEKAKNNGNLFVSFDPNYRSLLFGHQQRAFIDHCWNFLDTADFFKVSDEEALLLTGKATIEEAAALFMEKTYAVFAITLGSEGCLLGRKNRLERIRGMEIEPVDTTGAGDAFTGAVLWQLQQTVAARELSQEKWQEILSLANKAGAYTCTEYGAMNAFKKLRQKLG